ncbi:predicted protein [Naegleria gruberi]|uniref:Predicted protein n=1 Tax=Naegleria gruberi TaxID=5762 RepID=D2VLF7_NAEGR|nr:uncharacterized protein NAEGRDRAFT_50525 [Naegleria gruberi]EFC42304.1 predicted protein [Naegleria gruberi]|eukprot:XP_002675048.1 predicted protein [Naegleria gruberi strain NEG-M]
MTTLLPPEFKHEYLYYTNNYTNAFKQPTVKVWDNVLIGPTMYPFPFTIGNETVTYYLVDNQKMGQAQQVYSSANYSTMLSSYETSFFNYVGNITSYCENISISTKNYYIVTISMVAFCLFIVIPTMMLTLFFILKKDRKNAIQLNQTSENLLKETMSDMATRQAFKIFCNERGFGAHINAIEKIMSFKEHCEQSQEMQTKLIEITSDYVNKVNAMHDQNHFNHKGDKVNFKIDDKKTRAIFNISCEAEKKIKHKEYMKSSLIFDILEETQDVASSKVTSELFYAYDCYNNREKMFQDIDILPSMIMDKLEHELSDALINTHLDFKASLKNNTMLSNSEPHHTEIDREEFELELVNV